MKRSVYIDSIALDEAQKKWAAALKEKGLDKPLGSELISTTLSCGAVTAEALPAKVSSPAFHSSAMDGYAVRFEETFGANETNPLLLKIPDAAVYINTGEPIPEPFNAVIMIEDINTVTTGNDNFIEIIAPVTPYKNVRVTGEDIVATELILPENHRIRPMDVGALLAGGYIEVPVRKKPVAAIIPTGNELVPPCVLPQHGQVVDSNSAMLKAMTEELGATGLRYDIVRDDLSELKAAILKGVKEADMVLVIAGSSAGKRDFTTMAIAELGYIIVHGVNIKPGRPLLLGFVQNKPVIGIPGFPVSTYLTYNLFVKLMILTWLGVSDTAINSITAVNSRNISSTVGQEEFVRVKVGMVADGEFIATPLSRGAGAMMSLVRADGILRIPAMSEGVGAGTKIGIELITPVSDITNTIVCIGSHDNTLDVLFNLLRKRTPYSLSSAHVGSMGGLMAIKRGEAHIAGTHLLDEASGTYNVPFIEKFLAGEDVILINLVHREQGLIVKRGNPKGILSINDLKRPDVIFINRQAGTGTRLLTDKCLREVGISADMVKGYDRIEYTHMAVASAVASGVADTGMGILSAAVALNLDFIPVTQERYDFLMKRETYKLPMVEALFNIIRNDTEFREIVTKMGGYDMSQTGEIMYCNS
ncbi:molybdopterin biosynthesis protein [Candidatus Magnetomonas plexicatena]|uniref:molybdopterin biosynthesis protein n=1 Tax=Candidatus Magnetomonas plexicatena TaxID=2552947 RepID=UPI001C778B95|nr:molybdopterin biosynthesis protein [Nitrospirales bacterium LBB_01]